MIDHPNPLYEYVSFIEVEAEPRYWEDADVNGETDLNGDKIPLRENDVWHLTIDLNNGKILDWPEGTEAAIHYKVCDAGTYWLLDHLKERKFKYYSSHVPSDILCVNDNGWSDYIIFKISGNGFIIDWKKPTLDGHKWIPI